MKKRWNTSKVGGGAFFQFSGKMFILMLAVTTSLWASPKQIKNIHKNPDGILLDMQPGVLQLQVWSDSIIRVTRTSASELPSISSLSVIVRPGFSAWTLKNSSDVVLLETQTLRVRVDKKTSAVSFLDHTGRVLLVETAAGVNSADDPDGRKEGNRVGDEFALHPDEQIYGLGQHQEGLMSYRGTTVKLLQSNTQVAIPVLVSSYGYGLFWDNPSMTEVNIGIHGKESVVNWTSEVGKAVDYYFLFGPTADQIIRSYRQLTGDAPLMGKWVWGFWQSKEHYSSQKELLNIGSEYRRLGVPIDGVIQDWQYWRDGGWGSHEFDPSRYPDPPLMVNTLHNEHFHVFLSVWPRFDLNLENTKELEKAGALYPQTYPNVYPKGEGKWYDAFSAKGRELYWQQIARNLFVKGFDGWWLDASEPELGGKWGEFRDVPTASGPGAAVMNAYPLMTTTAVYKGQRATTDRKRVAILTRSAYAGQQRNAAITWSGDIHGSWEVFKKQIPAGLNFSISGIPYWNTDIGGFFGGSPKDPKYQELFTRWFEYGAFCPMFRVHGTGDGKEFWQWDERTQKIWRKYTALRYRLLPYIYSVSWQVTHEQGTMMRPLVMDFAEDRPALNISDQYMFGPAFLVNPVTDASATTRKVYLPGKKDWYDFWTGKHEGFSQQIISEAPIDVLPLYVRAGSIVLLGPEVQYAQEKPEDPIEVRVYRGANGAFTLYEDEGDNYSYEKGAYATISLNWDDRGGILTIGPRYGQFPSMSQKQIFQIVFVRDGHGVGEKPTEDFDSRVEYTGETVTVKVPK
jgi:alpha-D-xyloside xylohydrolase